MDRVHFKGHSGGAALCHREMEANVIARRKTALFFLITAGFRKRRFKTKAAENLRTSLLYADDFLTNVIINNVYITRFPRIKRRASSNLHKDGPKGIRKTKTKHKCECVSPWL